MFFFMVHPGSPGVAAPLAWPSLQAAAARTEQRRDQPLADRRLLYSFARNHASTLFIVAVRRRSTRVAPKPGECLRVADFSRRQARAASTLGSRLSRQRRPQARACARAQTCCPKFGPAVFHRARSPDWCQDERPRTHGSLHHFRARVLPHANRGSSLPKRRQHGARRCGASTPRRPSSSLRLPPMDDALAAVSEVAAALRTC